MSKDKLGSVEKNHECRTCCTVIKHSSSCLQATLFIPINSGLCEPVVYRKYRIAAGDTRINESGLFSA